MSEQLRFVLALVAAGRLSPAEAAPLIDALLDAETGASPTESTSDERADRPPTESGRQVRIRVSERGRQVVNLRIPLALADVATRMVPGLSNEQGERIRSAVSRGLVGPILDVEDEDGDGVLISVE